MKVKFDSGPTLYCHPIPADPWLRLLDYIVTLHMPPSSEKTDRINRIECATEAVPKERS